MESDFNKSEVKKIEIDKWDEGIRRRNDPGESFVIDWIKNNSVKFRQLWDVSLCRSCKLSKECGFKVEQICYHYEKE